MLLFNLFYPRTCCMCGRYVGEVKVQGEEPKTKAVLCEQCMCTLPRTEQAEKRQNETEMALVGKTSDFVATMKAMHLVRAATYLFFEKEQPVQDVIHKMKYADRPEIGFALGRQAAMEMQYADFFEGVEVIVPVPLHPKRLQERGYNQSEYIARGIADVIGVPVDTTHVTRVKNTPKQALMQAKDEGRKANVADAFAVNHPEQLYHKHILVVDDLITTGETMKACLQAMKRIRGAKFSVFALCKAR